MSLIPSESYSFPDHFTSTRAASRKLKNMEPEPEAEPVEPPPKKPAIVALPNPKPRPAPAPAPVAVRENPEPPRKIAPPVPIPLRRASAPPPKIPEAPVRKIALSARLKPKVRWNNRAPVIDPATAANNGNGNGAEQLPHAPPMPPAENVIQMKPAPPIPRPPRLMPRPENFPPPPLPRPAAVAPPIKPAPVAPPQRPVAPAKPAQPLPVLPLRKNTRPIAPPVKPESVPMREPVRPVIAANPQADFFEAFAENSETALSKRRRKEKMRRFLICEGIAVGVLLPLAIIGLSHRPESAALIWIMNMATIASAVAAALIPILFFALAPTLQEIER